MRILEPLESLSDNDHGVVFFTDVFKHGLRLPLRHSVQKILAAISYAPGQYNPNFWITLLGTIAAFNLAGEGEPSYEQWAQLYSVTRAKSADHGGWVQSNYLSAEQRGHFVVGVPSSQKTWRKRRVIVSGAWESALGVIVERRIPTTFQTVVSLKRPTAPIREVEVIEQVRAKIAEEDRFFKELLYFRNLYKAGLISKVEHDRRVKEEEEEEKRQMAGGRPMSEATRRRLEGQATPKQKKGESPRQKKKKAAGASGGASADEQTVADRRREKKAAEAEAIREVHLQVTGKRMIEGALDAMAMPKKPRLPNEGTSVLIPNDEGEGKEGPVNIACPQKAVPFINCMIDGAQMELSEIEQLSMKTLREQTDRAFRLQAAADMEMWLCTKRAVNAVERYQKKFDEGHSKIADAGKMLQEADRRAEENAAKIAELASKLAATELEVVVAQEAKAAVEVAMDAAERSHAKEVEEAKAKAVVDY
ncbi:hypothetical protein ACE6H2_020840 [Prunus campanulata]